MPNRCPSRSHRSASTAASPPTPRSASRSGSSPPTSERAHPKGGVRMSMTDDWGQMEQQLAIQEQAEQQAQEQAQEQAVQAQQAAQLQQAAVLQAHANSGPSGPEQNAYASQQE